MLSKSRIPATATCCLFLMISCSTTYDIMPSHIPTKIMETPVEETVSSADHLDFNKRMLILELVADLSVAPIGAYFDDKRENINCVNQTYVLSRPGHVLFEKIAETLQGKKAVVVRNYDRGDIAPNRTPQATTVSLLFEDIEFHVWNVSGTTPLFLVRAKVESRIRSVSGTTHHHVTLQAKVSSAQDPFMVLSSQYAEHLYGALGQVKGHD